MEMIPRRNCCAQSMSFQPKLADALHDMLRQVQMQVPWSLDEFAHIVVKGRAMSASYYANLLFVSRGSTPSTSKMVFPYTTLPVLQIISEILQGTLN
eukprot:1160187-Pelagomonas_calceolata.AAC.11